MTAPHLGTGRQGELYARRWLEARGLTHVCSNYRCRYGELDLVMRDSLCLVVVEVRFRRHCDFGGALLSVTPLKRARLARTAQSLLQRRQDLQLLPLRFDVIGLSGKPNSPLVDWRRHAFNFDDE